MGKRKTMPSVQAIYAHWGDRFGTPDETYCMACKEDSPKIERAHILAHFDGGDEALENLLLLCPICHKHQEFLSSVLAAGNHPCEGDDLKALLELAANDNLMMSLKRLRGDIRPISKSTENDMQSGYAAVP